jgi:hypothetical protein
MFSIASSSVQPGLATVDFKRVEVDHQQIDGGYAVGRQCRHVLGHIAPGQQAAVDLGMQGLDAAVQHFGKAGVVGDFSHRQAGVGQQLGRAAGGQQLDAQGVQRLREFEDAGFVGNGNQCVHGGVLKKGAGSNARAEGPERGFLFDELVLDQLLAQGVAVQAQPFGGARLVLFGVLHDDLQQRLFHHLDHHVIHAVGLGAAQVLEIAFQAGAYALFDVFLAHAAASS